jgi:hypothetical protein
MNLDELRGGGQSEFDETIVAMNDNFFDDVEEEKHFLGMTAVERMFLSIFLFMNVFVIGIALLLATGRLVL